MRRSFFSPAPADARRRTVPLAQSKRVSGTFELPSDVHRACRLLEREGSALNPVLVFTLQVAVGVAACVGTILALFAWTAAGL
jgi:hypothetical protein